MSAQNGKYQYWDMVAVVATIVVAVIADTVIGHFPVDIFSFPLNIIIVVLWLALLVELYRRRANSSIAQYMLSLRATWLSLGLMAAVGIMLGTQLKPATTSWVVVGSILFILSHLWMVILRGWRNKQGIRLRFILTHFGLWLALAAGFWGAADREELRMVVESGKPTDMTIDEMGQPAILDYDIELLNFDVEYYDNGTPSSYEAMVAVGNRDVSLRVNKPYNHTLSETIYLVSYGANANGEPYCILEIVREPWRWISTAGIIMLLAGSVMLFLRGPQRAKNKDTE